ncbi:MAG: proline dehydrogenase family protein [Phycisphaerales bacterium]|jgi:RHH-type proline utilization regulon transcriptional repressor/proline dehydrogenase/delta 1-pyrroline-5-carboxylate dehydrogenase|nr:proline dehydrogenase family protein [Phycisphaerales bacterium]
MPIFGKSKKPAPSGSPAVPTGGAQPQREARIQSLGVEMLDRARKHKAGLLSAKFYSDKLMDWSMKDQQFKVQMFRFVDAFPVLRTPESVHEHLTDYLTQPGVKLPAGMDLGLKAGGLAKGLLSGTISSQIKGMAQKFIAGTDAASALPGLRELWKDGIAFSVDLLGEACVSDAEADAYQHKYLDLVSNLPGEVAGWSVSERLERDHLGPIPRVNVSVKISSLSAKCDPIDTEGGIRDVMSRLVPILERAREKGVFINFDMEQFALKDLTIELFMRCCEKVDFQAGLAMQAYLKSGVDDAKRVCEWAKRTGRVVSVRLVKGAYWDYETIHAEQQGWPCPVWNEKWQTDLCFEQMAEVFLDATPRRAGEGGVKLALGSHNVRSIAATLAGLESRGLPREAIELQMLHGMADQLKHAGAEMGLRVREYVPVGEMIPGMAYLVRRLLENTSNESWLKAGFLDNADAGVLLRAPGPRPTRSVAHAQALDGVGPSNGTFATNPVAAGAGVHRDLYEVAPERHMLTPAVRGVGNERPFYTEPLRDFSKKPVREAFSRAIEGAVVRPVDSDRATERDAAEALENATAHFPAWRDTDPRVRAGVLVRVAAMMRSRRDELSGVIVREASKPWREADADVCEAIDFCEYYARLAVPLFERHRLGRFIGELDEAWYQPRGPAVIISPWNFPLAICAGMTSAALVTGNTVVVKPAEQTPHIAALMAKMFHDALREVAPGIHPEHTLRFLPGRGETVGAALVRDPRTAIIAFTGSKAVGLDIIRAAGLTGEDQAHVKKVVCEMGGKNAVIVDASADLDEAVLGVRYSAFGFSGQKCSACSRVIVVDAEGPEGEHVRAFSERLVEATRALVVGDPSRPGTDVGPVIDDASRDKIVGLIEQAKREGCRLALGEGVTRLPDSSVCVPKNLVPPHIFLGVRPEHTIAREEVFGPVLAVMHAHTFDDALAIANASPYKLTGGVFTRKPAHIERAKREFRIGNLYINRGITGALVGRQPFGGFGMSGVGSKAGGADYLMQFVEPRASCENTMRRGFAPEL